MLVSWNFKHLANVRRESGFNAVNLLQGYPPVRIVAPTFLIHGHTDHGEIPVLIPPLEVHEPGDLDLTRTTPSGPEVQDHDLFVLDHGALRKDQPGVVAHEQGADNHFVSIGVV